MIILVDASQSPYFLDLSKAFTQLLPLQDVNILCFSDTGPITIALPRSETLQGGNVRILVQDVSGEASVNNITVMTSGDDLINNSTNIAINTDRGFFEIRQGATPPAGTGYTGIWSAVTDQTGGGITPSVFDFTLTPQQVTDIFAGNAYQVVPDVALGRIIYGVQAKAIVLFNTQPYNTPSDSFLYLSSSAATATLGVIGRLPEGLLQADLTGLPNYGVDFSPRVVSQSFLFSSTQVGGGIYLKANDLFAITQGDSDIRVFGTYFIKDLI